MQFASTFRFCFLLIFIEKHLELFERRICARVKSTLWHSASGRDNWPTVFSSSIHSGTPVSVQSTNKVQQQMDLLYLLFIPETFNLPVFQHEYAWQR